MVIMEMIKILAIKLIIFVKRFIAQMVNMKISVINMKIKKTIFMI